MSGGLKMPGKGKAALLLSELNAEHAPRPEEIATPIETGEETNVTTLQRYNEETNEPTNVVTQQHENARSNDTSNEVTTERDNAPAKVATPKRTKVSGEGGAANRGTEREGRLTRALEIAGDDEIAVVTIRVSAKLNKYLDDYVERVNRLDTKRKYRKQDAIAEAFAAFYADHVMPPAPVDEEL